MYRFDLDWHKVDWRRCNRKLVSTGNNFIQRHNRLAFTPCASATAETEILGCWHIVTKSVLNSIKCARRWRVGKTLVMIVSTKNWCSYIRLIGSMWKGWTLTADAGQNGLCVSVQPRPILPRMVAAHNKQSLCIVASRQCPSRHCKINLE